jgi:hypothetical protein
LWVWALVCVLLLLLSLLWRPLWLLPPLKQGCRFGALGLGTLVLAVGPLLTLLLAPTCYYGP